MTHRVTTQSDHESAAPMCMDIGRGLPEKIYVVV